MLGQYVLGAGTIDDVFEAPQSITGAITMEFDCRPLVAAVMDTRPQIQATFATPVTDSEN